LRIGAVVLLLLGVGLAATGAVGAIIHGERAQVWAFVAVGVVLAGVAGLVARQVRWVIVVCFVALAGQLAAVLGTVAELVFGVAETRQRQLRGLGFDPTTAVVVNLVWSALGFGLFCWLALRWWARRRRGRGYAAEG
jgi:drug/metabolite transporter (DMT)-like permease